MPTWNDLISTFNGTASAQREAWLQGELFQTLSRIKALREDRNVIFYASGFLQKPQVGLHTLITLEDINGFMSVMPGMDWDKGLTLVLHTPGGQTNAVEPIVDYFLQKFRSFEVIIPTFAMSAGTMVSLASSRLVMGRQSQLGPIDPQMTVGGSMSVSAGSIVAQFESARQEIKDNTDLAHLWAPILQSLGPALLEEARNALAYSAKMVEAWLEKGMCASDADPKAKAASVASFFNDSGTHKSHGRRISRDDARAQGLDIEELEASQDLQDAVLTVYHLATILFGSSKVVKFVAGTQNNWWTKIA